MVAVLEYGGRTRVWWTYWSMVDVPHKMVGFCGFTVPDKPDILFPFFCVFKGRLS